MFSCPERPARVLAALVLAGTAVGAFGQSGAYPGVGRAATASEIRAWDIDVRPDFKGLPPGRGSVARGMEVWEAKCASCHGIFGESNEVFAPLVGGTTKEDVKTGRVARLTDASFPGRTTLMKVSTLSTLWDYINRAMPWNAPKSLSTEEVYGVTAYLLNMGGIVPDDYVLSHENMAATQALLPNRNGTTTRHGLWPGKSMGNGGRPDVTAVACMTGCQAEATVASYLPDHARNAHGNLAEQNRPVGAQHGADTSRPPGAAPAAPVPAAARPAEAGGAAPLALATRLACTACHGVENRIVGPGFREIAKKHGTRADAASYLAGKIRAGGTGVWGAIPMPPQTLSDADAQALAQWIAEGARR